MGYCALRAAAAAGAVLRRAFHRGEADDSRAEEEIRKILTVGFPQYGYHGEEFGVRFASGRSSRTSVAGRSGRRNGGCRKGLSGSIGFYRAPEGWAAGSGCRLRVSARDDAGDWFTWAEGTGPINRNGKAVSILGANAPETILISQHSDRNAQANAILAAPMRFRAVPSIPYRLALVAAGEARAGVSLNGPVGWDHAGGHALLLGAGLDLHDRAGRPVRYDRHGNSSCGGRCFGGSASLACELAGGTGTLCCTGAERTLNRTRSAGLNGAAR